MRIGSDRHQSAEITNIRALIRVLSSFFARIGDRSRLQLASSEHIARQELEKKRYGIKKQLSNFLLRGYARILESIERTKNNETQKKQQRSVTDNTHLDLGGLEAGDGRDLLSSGKHYCKFVEVFSCV